MYAITTAMNNKPPPRAPTKPNAVEPIATSGSAPPALDPAQARTTKLKGTPKHPWTETETVFVITKLEELVEEAGGASAIKKADQAADNVLVARTASNIQSKLLTLTKQLARYAKDGKIFDENITAALLLRFGAAKSALDQAKREREDMKAAGEAVPKRSCIMPPRSNLSYVNQVAFALQRMEAGVLDQNGAIVLSAAPVDLAILATLRAATDQEFHEDWQALSDAEAVFIINRAFSHDASDSKRDGKTPTLATLTVGAPHRRGLYRWLSAGPAA